MKRRIIFLVLINNFAIAQCDTVKSYWESGLIKSKGCIIMAKKNGFWTYYQNYKLSPIDSMGTYINDKKQGLWMFYGNGNENIIIREGQFVNDKKNGFWKELCFEGFYKDGLKAGRWICHTATDTNLVDEINYSNGVNHGMARAYYPNGSIRFISFYYKGKLNKEYLKYSMEGKLMEKGQYKNGQMDGVWRNYDDSGIPISKGKYKKGVKVGVWLYYDERSNLIKEEKYNNIGELKKTVNYRKA